MHVGVLRGVSLERALRVGVLRGVGKLHLVSAKMGFIRTLHVGVLRGVSLERALHVGVL